MKKFILLITLIQFVLHFVDCQQYIVQPAAGTWYNPSGPELEFSVHTKIFNHRKVTGYLAVVSQPMGYFNVMYPQLPNSTCGGYLNTTQVAAERGCLFATNAGPFVMHQPYGQPTCLGYIVANGTIAQVDSTANANFGLTNDGSFVMGVLSTQQVLDMNFNQLVSGFGWLVQAGQNMVATAGGEIAPRTAIATDPNGKLLIFEADGAEKAELGPIGLTLQETAAWFMELGAYNAINLDGGGSSVTFYNGTMVSKPTCIDTPVVCERAVTTMTCIMP